MSANATVTLNLGAANDPPVLVVPVAQSIAQNFQTPITGISVSDVDVGSGIMTATLSVSNGVITLTQTTRFDVPPWLWQWHGHRGL